MFLSRVTLQPDIGASTQLGKLLLQRPYGAHQLLWDLFEQSDRNFLYREEIAKEQLTSANVKGEPVYYLLSLHQPKKATPLFRVESKPFQPLFSAGQHLSFRLRANPTVSRNKQRHDLVMDERQRFYRQLSEMLNLHLTGSKFELLQQLQQAGQTEKLHTWLSQYLAGTRYAVEPHHHYSLSKLLDLALQEAVDRRLISWLIHKPSREGIFSLAPQQQEHHPNQHQRPAFTWNGYRRHPLPEKGPKASFRSVDLSGELIIHDAARFLKLLQRGIGTAKGFGCGLMLVKPVQFRPE